MTRIAILGGGPGAGACALALARGGLPATLYHHPRPGEKPCGGAVPELLLRDLAPLGFDASGLPGVVGPGAVVENAGGEFLRIPAEGLRIFRRRDLDSALVAAAVAAGAHRVRARVEGVAWRGGAVVVTAGGGEESYDWVVGADGARGLSRRALGIEPREESVGLGATLRGLPWQRLVLSLPAVADSYLWIFPRPGGASVGIAYSSAALSPGAAKAQLSAFLERFLPVPDRFLRGPRYRYPIPVFNGSTPGLLERAAARRILLVGDAAGLADPLTREGIRYAVRSGIWAAEALLGGEARDYPQRVVGELAGEMGRARRARGLFFEGPVGQWVVPVSRWHPGIRQVLADLLACRQPYQGLRRRLLAAALTGPSRRRRHNPPGLGP